MKLTFLQRHPNEQLVSEHPCRGSRVDDVVLELARLEAYVGL